MKPSMASAAQVVQHQLAMLFKMHMVVHQLLSTANQHSKQQK
jgi:hypothetical protein